MERSLDSLAGMATSAFGSGDFRCYAASYLAQNYSATYH